MLISLTHRFLSQVREGEKVTIEALYEGNDLNRRLASLGFTPGVDVEIMQNFGRGPMIVKVRGTKIAIGRGEAEKIKVDGPMNE
jgi:Fe2+ transport system protein FeoA